MNVKLTRALALGIFLGIAGVFAGCTTAPPQELSIIDAVNAGSLSQPQSCAARNGATVCVKTMRLNQDKASCGCVDRREFSGAPLGF